MLVATARPKLSLSCYGFHSTCGTAPTDYELMADAMDCSADVSASITGMPEYSDNCGAVDCWGAASLYVWHEDSEWTYTCAADDAALREPVS